MLQELGKNVDHGHRIAATGEIFLNGAVGPIGGIKQKTIGARQAGVDAFLVPVSNAPEAKKYAHGLRIIPVKSFQQALHALATLPAASLETTRNALRQKGRKLRVFSPGKALIEGLACVGSLLAGGAVREAFDAPSEQSRARVDDQTTAHLSRLLLPPPRPLRARARAALPHIPCRRPDAEPPRQPPLVARPLAASAA